MKTKIGMLSLGCARNLVDAEVILGSLRRAGFAISEQVGDADVAIVNTCCFIREAQEESIDIILKLCRLKQEGRIDKIVVCGCLVQRYKNELVNEFKEVDAFVGVGSINKVTLVVKELLDGVKPLAPTSRGLRGRKTLGLFAQPQFLYTHSSPRVFLTPRHFAYIKISEGCDHCCSYCIIPRLRGRYRSRPMDSILKEVQGLLRQGVQELNLIGQDTTMYGQDLYGKGMLIRLLAGLSARAKGRWVRLLYAHPAHFSGELIAVIKNEPSICKYVDLPIQHINDTILKKMNRNTSRRHILSLIDRLRKEVPALAIRTTLIVGFPGETDAQFKQLLNFIRQVRFERLGLFKYSRETETPAYDFVGQIPEKVKEVRYNQALSLQQDISTEINERFLGKRLCVLIDGADEKDKNIFLGRSQADAPEVDGCVYVKSAKRLRPGDFVQVKIIDTLEYDLVGEAE